jgi:hypothetical protein
MLRPSYFLGQSVLTALLLACASLQAAELPAPVAASIAQISPTASLGEITPFEDAGETLYNVEVQTPGSPGAREWYFDSQGIPVGVQAFEKELPPALRESLSLHLKQKDTELSDVVKLFESDRFLFEVELRVGRESKVLGFYSDGLSAYTEARLAELPQPLRKSIKQLEQTEGTVESILRLETSGRGLYQLAVSRPGKPLWITLNASGTALEREEVIDYKTTPESVQAAIVAKTGSGQRVRILLKHTGKIVEFEVHFFRDSKLHTLHLSETGETKGPSVEPLKLP